MKITKILVPVDFSEFSRRALTYAIYLARESAAHITLLHAVVLHYEEADEMQHLKNFEKVVELQEKRLQAELARHHIDTDQHGIIFDSRIIRGVSAPDVILEFISQNDYDVVVMGTHGRTGVKKWLYGSVTEKVVRHSPVPVLTIHNLWKKFIIESILVPVDFSEYSKKAIEAAKELAKQFDARLTFLHVISQEVHPAYYATSYDSLFIIDRQLRERSLRNLKEFVGSGVTDAGFEIKEGQPYKEIVGYAEEMGCDLIVMATRGLTGLEHLLIGSTSERVVRMAKCPVLTLERGELDA